MTKRVGFFAGRGHAARGAGAGSGRRSGALAGSWADFMGVTPFAKERINRSGDPSRKRWVYEKPPSRQSQGEFTPCLSKRQNRGKGINFSCRLTKIESRPRSLGEEIS